jgi:hypothetical protein
VADSGDGKKTAEEREALAARDLRLKRGLIAGDRALTAEAFEIIRVYLGKVAKRRARWLLRENRWKDCCQSVFALIIRWQDEGGEHIDETESLWYFTIRVLKQVAEPLKKDKDWAQLAFSLDQEPTRSKKQLELDEEAAGSVHAPQHFVPTERQAVAKEEWGWVEETAQRLSEEDRAVIRAVGDVADGEAETLGEALGTKDGTARMRKRRLMERLARAAITEGNREMARRCAGKAYADALELLYVAEPGADHRIDELMLLRDGELPTAKKIELEKHMETCAGCKRTVRTLSKVEASVLAVLLVEPPDFDFSRFLPKAPGSPVGKALGIGAGALLAAALALGWWMMRSQAEPPPPPRQPPASQKAVPKRPRPFLQSAPIPPPEPVDAGK